MTKQMCSNALNAPRNLAVEVLHDIFPMCKNDRLKPSWNFGERFPEIANKARLTCSKPRKLITEVSQIIPTCSTPQITRSVAVYESPLAYTPFFLHVADGGHFTRYESS